MRARTLSAAGLIVTRTPSTSVCSQCLRDDLRLTQPFIQSRKYRPSRRQDVSPFGAAATAAQAIFKGLPKAPPGVSVDPLRIVGKELKFLSHNIRQLLGSGHPALDKVAKYYTRSEGKHMRPLLVLLMSQATALDPRKDLTRTPNTKPVDISQPTLHPRGCKPQHGPLRAQAGRGSERLHRQ